MSLRLAPLPNPALDLDAVAALTYSAVFSDICDAMGLRDQTASPGLLPLDRRGTLAGWARTALFVPVDAPPARPYGGEIEFVDSLRAGDVAVVDGSGRPAAGSGELFSTAAKGRGARGAVVDGLVRDGCKIVELGFPCMRAAAGRPTAWAGSRCARPTRPSGWEAFRS